MKKENLKAFFQNKTVRILLVALAALLLLLAVWKVFFSAETKPAAYQPTAQEERLEQLLSQIEGVRNATVMISISNDETVGAVVVFEGADSILTRIRVIEVASNALNLSKERILVYPS